MITHICDKCGKVLQNEDRYRNIKFTNYGKRLSAKEAHNTHEIDICNTCYVDVISSIISVSLDLYGIEREVCSELSIKYMTDYNKLDKLYNAFKTYKDTLKKFSNSPNAEGSISDKKRLSDYISKLIEEK